MTRLASVALPLALAAWATASAQVIVNCPRAPQPPILDGNVTVDEWIVAGRLSPFVRLHDGVLAERATDVRVMFDNEALYLAAVLYDPDPAHLQAQILQPDGEVYRDDCFELFIDAFGTGEAYDHLAINPIGTRFDESGGDRTLEIVWMAGVGVREDAWTVEIAIPFTGGRPPAEGSVWRIGAARNAPRSGELSSWNGFLDGFHEPQRFGEMRFGGPHVLFSLADPGARKLGRNTAVLVVDNATDRPRRLKANVRVHGRDRAGHHFSVTKIDAPIGSRTSANLPYEITQDGVGSVLISVTDEQGVPLYRTAPIAVRVPAVAGSLFAVERALAQANRDWAALPDGAVRADLGTELDSLATEWRELSTMVGQRASLDPVQLEELRTALERLLTRVEQTALRLQAARGGEAASFIAVPTSSLTKVFPDEPPPSGASTVRLDVCRNERESFQVALASALSAGVRLSVHVEPLQGASATLPAESLQVHAVGCVPAADHLTRDAPRRLWPDLLTPGLMASDPFAVPSGETRSLWVSVQVPPDVPPGEYTGSLTLTDADGASARVPLHVAVHVPVLPSPGDYHLCVGFWQAPERIAQQYGLELWSRDHWQKVDAYLRDLAAHGQKLATVTRNMVEWRTDADGKPVFRYPVLDRYLQACRDAGITGGLEYYAMFRGDGPTTLTWADANGDTHALTANPGDEAFDSWWSAFLADLARHLEEKGWLGDVFICPTDEPRDAREVPTLQRFARCADLVHAAHPAFRTTVALDSLESARTLAPCVDRMVFKLRDDVYDRELAAATRAAGGRTEAYICCHPDRPNTFITSPSVDCRVIGWLLFREQLSGLLRWSYERWPPDPVSRPEGDGRYPAGDLFIVYPGSDGPYASTRWEILRDGFEDYELLLQMQTAIAKARAAGRPAEADQAQQVLDEAVLRVTGEGPGLAAFASDPQELLVSRVKLLTTLDWLGAES